MTQLLISVTGLAEAQIALRHGVDVVDLKNPAQGALGALPINIIIEVINYVNSTKLVSATVGDVLMQSQANVDEIAGRVEALTEVGVDIIKIGFFESHGHANHQGNPNMIFAYRLMTILKAMSLPKSVKLVAVLFAENHYHNTFITQLLASGFGGVMIDTLKKNGKTYLDYGDDLRWLQMAEDIKKRSSWFGVAGSLQTEHIDRVLCLNPTYVGFRGAVCELLNRKNALSAVKVQQLRKLI